MLLVYVKRPALIVGCIIGASTAIDFALHHPKATAKLNTCVYCDVVDCQLAGRLCARRSGEAASSDSGL